MTKEDIDGPRVVPGIPDHPPEATDYTGGDR